MNKLDEHNNKMVSISFISYCCTASLPTPVYIYSSVGIRGTPYPQNGRSAHHASRSTLIKVLPTALTLTFLTRSIARSLLSRALIFNVGVADAHLTPGISDLKTPVKPGGRLLKRKVVSKPKLTEQDQLNKIFWMEDIEEREQRERESMEF